jgi:hypothetical protein
LAAQGQLFLQAPQDRNFILQIILPAGVLEHLDHSLSPNIVVAKQHTAISSFSHIHAGLRSFLMPALKLHNAGSLLWLRIFHCGICGGTFLACRAAPEWNTMTAQTRALFSEEILRLPAVLCSFNL